MEKLYECLINVAHNSVKYYIKSKHINTLKNQRNFTPYGSADTVLSKEVSISSYFLSPLLNFLVLYFSVGIVLWFFVHYPLIIFGAKKSLLLFYRDLYLDCFSSFFRILIYIIFNTKKEQACRQRLTISRRQCNQSINLILRPLKSRI